MKRSKTSKQWMNEHVNDPYVQRAQIEGYRSRAAYKLLEIDERDHLLKPGMVVVDLGATPGGWSQVAVAKVGPGGKVIALDLLPLHPIHGVEFIQGDFREDSVLAQLEKKLEGRGRIVVRYSGTETLLRIMVEGETHEEIVQIIETVSDAVNKYIGVA